MKKKNRFKKVLLFVIAVFFLTAFTATRASAGTRLTPRLNLFPSDVAEHLSNTGTVAATMEKGLKETIQKLEAQKKLYDETGCKGSDDPGCEEIAKQMGDHYMEMITIMKEHLPEMKQSIMATNKGIEKNLRKELGKKATPADIQRLISKSKNPRVFKNGRYSLSKRFARYYELIRAAGSGNNLATLASEIYLDSRGVLDTIDLMDAEIARQETLHKLGQMYGTLTPEMMNTVSAVKAVIFGEQDNYQALPEAGPKETGKFKSPLEME